MSDRIVRASETPPWRGISPTPDQPPPAKSANLDKRSSSPCAASFRRLSERKHRQQRRMNNDFVIFLEIEGHDDPAVAKSERLLSNDQFAAMLLLQLHRLIQRQNRAFNFAIVRR